MQKSCQPQPVDPRDIIDLTGDEDRVCDTCGDVGLEHFLAFCNECNDGAEHIYCMRVKMEELPEDGWTCEECMPREGTGKLVQDKVEQPVATNRSKHLSENSIDPESRKSSKLKSRSSYSMKSGISTPHLQVKRCQVPSEAQSLEKASATMTNAGPHILSGPCDDSPLHKGFSYKKFGKVKMKSVNKIMHFASQYCNSQEKAMVPRGYGEKSNVVTLEDELGIEGRALETRERSSKVSSPRDQSLLSRHYMCKNLKRNLEGVIIDTSCKKSFCDTKEMAASSNCSIDESPNLHSQTETTRDECSLLESRSPNLESGPATKDVCLQKHNVNKYPALHDDRNDTCSGVLANGRELHNPAMCLQASSSGVTANRSEIEIASDENLFSGTVSYNLDHQGSEQFNAGLQPSNHNTHEDLDIPNEKNNEEPDTPNEKNNEEPDTPNEKNNDIQQAEHLINAATAQIIHELCAGLALDERSCLRDLGVRSSSQAFVYPKLDHSWQGKFLIQSIGEIATICDGIQAHLSTCASPKVIDVVDRLPEMIILDELPRLTMWPSQFTEGQPTEENIALYFFAEDPRSYRTCYKQLVDLMIKNDLALKGNLDGVELLIFPSNILPEKSQRKKWSSTLNCGIQLGNRVDEIPEPDRTSGDTVLLSGDSSNDNGINEVVDCEDVDLTLSLWPEALDSVELQVARALVHLSKAKQQ
ncbi:uncharacterized protein LOC107642656 [Arachis ipaensis]|uniref:uncharacterized protein LOC107642656 n=1 Tax=Arachis ipaensis TaxID=130454 RepID=UPI000A2B2661|nr:uncharacterized protein LOC107642656 [Arachis ipaensis]